jgi:CRP-like cAMP-binding protein
MLEKNFNYNQAIYKQGEESNGVYLIKEGQFEVTKRNLLKKNQTIKDKIQSKLMVYAADRNKDSINVDLNKLTQLRVAILGKNQIFGHEECIFESNEKSRNGCHWSSSEKSMNNS